MKTAEDILKNKGYKIVSINSKDTVRRAVEVIVENKIGAVVVMESEEIIGIWTERDLLRNTIKDGFNPETTRIEEVMSKNLKFAESDESIYKLMDKMVIMRVRHLFIKKGDDCVGILTARDIIKACLQEKSEELKALKSMVSWEYYETWKK